MTCRLNPLDQPSDEVLNDSSHRQQHHHFPCQLCFAASASHMAHHVNTRSRPRRQYSQVLLSTYGALPSPNRRSKALFQAFQNPCEISSSHGKLCREVFFTNSKTPQTVKVYPQTVKVCHLMSLPKSFLHKQYPPLCYCSFFSSSSVSSSCLSCLSISVLSINSSPSSSSSLSHSNCLIYPDQLPHIIYPVGA